MKKTVILIFLFLFVFSASAQNAADIDSSFNTEGWFGNSGNVKKIAHSVNGKIVVCGNINFYKGIPVNNIFSLNSDGSLDTSFNPGTTFSSSVTTFAIQPDGKIIAAGYSTSSSIIKRLNEDGSVDASFNVSFNYPAQCFGIQPDGKILVGADTNTLLDKIIRLNTNGTLDSSFDLDAPSITVARCIIVESDGKIIVGGQSTASLDAPSLIRLYPGGSVDPTFSSGVFSTINTLSKQPDGKIIVGGNLSFGSSLGDDHNVARILANGQIDISFTPGNVDSLEVYASAVSADGKILIGGSFSEYNQTSTNNIVCLNTDGSIDDSFDSGIGFNHHIYALDAYSGNTFFAGGDYTYYNTTDTDSIVLINSNGSTNTGFVGGRIVYTSSGPSSLDYQTDGKLVTGGSFNHYNNELTNGLVRFNSDGSRDTSFNIGTGFKLGMNSGFVQVLTVQLDGKIIIGGLFSEYNGTSVTNLIRLNTDGSIDATFTNGNPTNLNYSVHEALIQPDGKVLVVGSSYSSWSSDKIMRFNPNGTLDATFTVGAFNRSADAIALQPDGKIIVGGSFSTFNALAARGIIRLNTDGTIDATFNPGTGFDTDTSSVRALALQPDGKIIVGGNLRDFNGVTTIRHILRLNTNGTIDPIFITGSGFNGSLISLALDSDGRILAGGNFYSYSGTSSNRIIRLNIDGTVDSQFNAGSGFNGTPNITVLPNGKIMTNSGSFSSYNGTIAKQIIRLNGNSVLGTQNNSLINKMSFYSNPVKDILQLKLDDFIVVKSYAVFDYSGKEIKSETTFNFNNRINVMDLSKGIYIVKVETNHRQFTDKFIKE